MYEFIKLSVFIASFFEVLGDDEQFHVNRKRSVSMCEVHPCLRKCCPTGQFLMNRTCRETEDEFDFSELGVDPGAPIQDEVVTCGEGQTRFMLDSTDEFFVDEENNLVWPLINSSVSYMFYCIDMIDDIGAPKALMCYGELIEDNRLYYCLGNVFLCTRVVIYLRTNKKAASILGKMNLFC